MATGQRTEERMLYSTEDEAQSGMSPISGTQPDLLC